MPAMLRWRAEPKSRPRRRRRGSVEVEVEAEAAGGGRRRSEGGEGGGTALTSVNGSALAISTSGVAIVTRAAGTRRGTGTPERKATDGAVSTRRVREMAARKGKGGGERREGSGAEWRVRRTAGRREWVRGGWGRDGAPGPLASWLPTMGYVVGMIKCHARASLGGRRTDLAWRRAGG